MADVLVNHVASEIIELSVTLILHLLVHLQLVSQISIVTWSNPPRRVSAKRAILDYIAIFQVHVKQRNAIVRVNSLDSKRSKIGSQLG